MHMQEDRFRLNQRDRDIWLRYTEMMRGSTERWIPKQVLVDVSSRRLDLHGYHLHEAWHRFREFVEQHHAAGSRSVVVITGKSGQISREFREWCRMMPSVARYEPLGHSTPAGSYRVVLRSATRR